jgi:hypothetical protein
VEFDLSCVLALTLANPGFARDSGTGSPRVIGRLDETHHARMATLFERLEARRARHRTALDRARGEPTTALAIATIVRRVDVERRTLPRWRCRRADRRGETS